MEISPGSAILKNHSFSGAPTRRTEKQKMLTHNYRKNLKISDTQKNLL